MWSVLDRLLELLSGRYIGSTSHGMMIKPFGRNDGIGVQRTCTLGALYCAQTTHHGYGTYPRCHAGVNNAMCNCDKIFTKTRGNSAWAALAEKSSKFSLGGHGRKSEGITRRHGLERDTEKREKRDRGCCHCVGNLASSSCSGRAL